MEHGRFQLNITKYFFTVQFTEHWRTFPRELVDSLRILKKCLDKWCWYWATSSMVPFFSRRIGPDQLQRLLPDFSILWYCTFVEDPELHFIFPSACQFQLNITLHSPSESRKQKAQFMDKCLEVYAEISGE